MKWFSACLVATGVLLFVSACHEVSSSCSSNNADEVGEQIYDTRLVGKVDNRQVFAFCYRSSEYLVVRDNTDYAGQALAMISTGYQCSKQKE